MKRLLVLVVTLVLSLMLIMSFSLAGCKAKAAVEEEAVEEEEVVEVAEEEYSVYMIVHGGIAHPFWRCVEKGAMDASALYPDLKVTYNGPDVYDVEEFVTLVDAAVSASPDGIICTITTEQGLDEPLRGALDSGISVIAINAPDTRPEDERIPYLTYIGEDPVIMGSMVARNMIKMMRDKGVEPTGAVYGNHAPGAINIQKRIDGFKAVCEEEGIPFEQVDVTADPVDGAEILTAFLVAHPDINMVQPAGSPHTEAFIPRVKEEGIIPGEDIYVATIDITPGVLDYIESDEMLFTSDQQQYLQGYISVVNMYLNVKYGFVPPPPPMSTGEAVITKDNVALARQLGEEGYK